MNSRKIKKNLRVLIQPTPNGKKWWVSGAFTTTGGTSGKDTGRDAAVTVNGAAALAACGSDSDGGSTGDSSSCRRTKCDAS